MQMMHLQGTLLLTNEFSNWIWRMKWIGMSGGFVNFILDTKKTFQNFGMVLKKRILNNLVSEGKQCSCEGIFYTQTHTLSLSYEKGPMFYCRSGPDKICFRQKLFWPFSLSWNSEFTGSRYRHKSLYLFASCHNFSVCVCVCVCTRMC